MIKVDYRFTIKFILFIVILTPWFLTDSQTDITAEKVTSDLSFYEINTCKISLFEFLSKNLNTIYQEHYSFTLNNYSSVSCFGKIAGLTQVGHDFYIAIGTNSLVSILIQGLFFVFCISFIKPKDNQFSPSKLKHFLSIGFSSIIFCLLVYAEIRFYEKSFYMLDLSSVNSYLLIFLIFYSFIKKVVELINDRIGTISNYIPFMFLFVGAFTGLNANLYIFIFLYYGIYSVLDRQYKFKSLTLITTLTLFWGINAINDNYGFKPDKFRGFTSSFFNYHSVVVWSFIFFLIIFGLNFIFKRSLNSFDFKLFQKNLLITSVLTLLIGYISATNPFIRFLSYFYFGQEKMNTTESNLFRFDEWSEKVAWRGYFSSAETAGEFYGLVIIFLLFININSISNKLKIAFYCVIPLSGLYFSNNRTVFILLSVSLIFYFLKEFPIGNIYKFLGIFSTIGLAVLFIGVDKFTYEYSYQSIFIQANLNSLNSTTSTYLNLLNTKYGTNNIFTFIFSTFTFIGYIFNRSELWGLYFARYNPNYFEYLFGSGPMNFGQLYSEINIKETKSFLYPHSSLLSLILFFGIIGTLLLIIFLVLQIVKNKRNLDFSKTILIYYLVINLIKSDSINYLHAFTMYYFLFFLIFNSRKYFFSRNGD